ncbi:Uncharacterized protein HZ326_25291 [Fusarium oxysporum f. sp. albedinis]|nr:Uncharacterized protein HZ326_25291 [Fusarium oxysporum f. sp. albedinis]
MAGNVSRTALCSKSGKTIKTTPFSGPCGAARRRGWSLLLPVEGFFFAEAPAARPNGGTPPYAFCLDVLASVELVSLLTFDCASFTFVKSRILAKLINRCCCPLYLSENRTRFLLVSPHLGGTG